MSWIISLWHNNLGEAPKNGLERVTENQMALMQNLPCSCLVHLAMHAELKTLYHVQMLVMPLSHDPNACGVVHLSVNFEFWVTTSELAAPFSLHYYLSRLLCPQIRSSTSLPQPLLQSLDYHVPSQSPYNLMALQPVGYQCSRSQLPQRTHVQQGVK